MFQQAIKNFIINFNALNQRNTVSSGDLLTGHISFDLTKKTKITSITMALMGRANVHWSTGGGGGGRRRRRHRRNYSAKVDFFNLKNVIMQKNGAVGGWVDLLPGTHVYPFSCQLPRGDFPSTFRGVHGQIAYTLTVGINRPWHMSKTFVTELNFVNHIDANQPQLQAPLSGSNNMMVWSLCCALGQITMTVGVSKKVFSPDETVKVVCKFSNSSSRQATPKVKLQQKQIFYTTNKVSMTAVTKNLALLTGHPVDAHTSNVRTELLLTIPSTAPLTISNCSILEVDYCIEVGGKRRAEGEPQGEMFPKAHSADSHHPVYHPRKHPAILFVSDFGNATCSRC